MSFISQLHRRSPPAQLLVIPHAHFPGSYKRKIKYDLPMEQIVSIIQQSQWCEQFIKYECYHSKMWIYTEPYSWWVSRNGAKMNYWGGAAVGSGASNPRTRVLDSLSCPISDTPTPFFELISQCTLTDELRPLRYIVYTPLKVEGHFCFKIEHDSVGCKRLMLSIIPVKHIG